MNDTKGTSAPPAPSETTTTTENNDDTLYIIVGAAAVGFVFAVVALAILAFRRRAMAAVEAGAAAKTTANSVSALAEEGAMVHGNGGSGGRPGGGGGGGGDGGAAGGGGNPALVGDVASEIYVGEKDDISTLGDPVIQQTGMMTTGAGAEVDEQTASVENDYDYTQMHQKSQGVSSLDSFDRPSSDNSLQYSIGGGYDSGGADNYYSSTGSPRQVRFEVSVPPGKLGMVIDTPNGGVPWVHAIKSDSILAPHVKVGDRLVLVDGDDVTIMSAMQVSQLISLKSDQNRVLVFVRQQQQSQGSMEELDEEKAT